MLQLIGGIMRSLLFAITVVSTALLSFLKTSAVSAEPAVEDVKRCIEGVYVLEEFKKDGQVFRPPQIAGRWMVLNGVVMFIFHDRTQQSEQMSIVGFGHYTLSATAFAYRYDDYARYTHTSAGTSVSREPPWEGMLSFTPVLEQDGMHLRTDDSPTNFLCWPDGLLTTLGPRTYRKYRRTSE
jgi:hypothetical protein